LCTPPRGILTFTPTDTVRWLALSCFWGGSHLGRAVYLVKLLDGALPVHCILVAYAASRVLTCAYVCLSYFATLLLGRSCHHSLPKCIVRWLEPGADRHVRVPQHPLYAEQCIRKGMLSVLFSSLVPYYHQGSRTCKSTCPFLLMYGPRLGHMSLF